MLKISVCFYICGMAVTMVALVALWVIADAAGVIHSVEKFFGDLLQTKDFTFLDGEILRGALLVSAVLVVLQIVITVIAAAFYNVFAELFGGDRDHDLRGRIRAVVLGRIAGPLLLSAALRGYSSVG